METGMKTIPGSVPWWDNLVNSGLRPILHLSLVDICNSFSVILLTIQPTNQPTNQLTNQPMDTGKHITSLVDIVRSVVTLKALINGLNIAECNHSWLLFEGEVKCHRWATNREKWFILECLCENFNRMCFIHNHSNCRKRIVSSRIFCHRHNSRH